MGLDPSTFPKWYETVWPSDLLRHGARFIFLPICAYCKKQAPQCSCGLPNKRPL